MNVLIAAVGTRGDVQPAVALALGLSAHGHRVRFAVPPNFQAWVESLGLEVIPIGFDVEDFIGHIGYRALKGTRRLRGQTQVQFDALDEVASEVDLLVGTSVFAAGPTLAERHRIPYRHVGFGPSLLPSREHPGLLVKWQRLPRWLNRLSWRLNSLGWNLAFRGPLSRMRARAGLGPVEDLWRHLWGEEAWIAADPALAPLPADAEIPAVQTGCWWLPEPEPISAETAAFLARGPAPVFLGFGSMGDPNPSRTTATVLEAVRRAGVRAIVSRGWAKLDAAAPSSNVHFAGPEPHGKLFARCAAIVHHGGAGTTSQAARAGVPQLLVPHLLDQFFWADRVWRAGLSPKPIPRTRLNADRLARGLRSCLDDTLAERARALAPRMTTDGVERAVRLVEALAPGRSEAANRERRGVG